MAQTIPGTFRYADAHDMYRYLGVTSLPIEGMPPRLIHGVMVYVKPLPPPTGATNRWNGRPARNFCGLRVIAICACGRHVPVGRLHQHICKTPASPHTADFTALPYEACPDDPFTADSNPKDADYVCPRNLHPDQPCICPDCGNGTLPTEGQ